MAVVEQISHRVAVMYLGRIVEIGHARARSSRTRATPTRGRLLAAVPVPDPGHPRLPAREMSPFDADAPLREVDPGHFVAA